MSSGVGALMAAQFLGSLNDNLLKIVISLLAANAALSVSGASMFLSLTGMVFVVPYLLFAGYAGVVADVYDKRRVLIGSKIAEVILMGLATVALAGPHLGLLLATLFLVASQATFFSPARYGIVPELVDAQRLAGANGFLEAARQLGIISGTVIGGVLLGLWANGPEAIGAVMVAIAVLGWFAACRIRRGSGAPTRAAVASSSWRAVSDGLRRLRRDRRLGWAVLGTTWFDLLTTVVMLDLLLVAKHTMGLADTWVAILGAIGGVGVGLGALLAGRQTFARHGVGLVPVAGLGIGVTLIALFACTASFGAMAMGVGALGVFGGLFVVPLYTRLQREADPDQRGRIIATNNFLNMGGVLVGSALLWQLIDVAGLKPTAVLVVLGAACTGLMVLVLVVQRVGRGGAPSMDDRFVVGRVRQRHDACRRCRTRTASRVLSSDA